MRSITPHGYIFIKPAGVKVFVPGANQQAKTSHESVRNAGASIVAQGMLTPGVLAMIIKRDGGCLSESRAGGGPDVTVRGWCGKCDGRKDGGVVAGGSIPRGDAHRGICRHGT